MQPLTPQEWNAPGLWYKVKYKPANTNETFQEKPLKNLLNITSYVVNIGKENYYKPYLVKVQAINNIGEGPYSDEKQIYSAEDCK